MRRHLGIDLAITAESRACLTDETGQSILERRFHIRRGDLEDLYAAVTDEMGPDDQLVVVMEPTGSSWIAPAAFFRSKGARVHLVKPEQSADLREYYAKHVKNDRMDAALLLASRFFILRGCMRSICQAVIGRPFEGPSQEEAGWSKRFPCTVVASVLYCNG